MHDKLAAIWQSLQNFQMIAIIPADLDLVNRDFIVSRDSFNRQTISLIIEGF